MVLILDALLYVRMSEWVWEKTSLAPSAETKEPRFHSVLFHLPGLLMPCRCPRTLIVSRVCSLCDMSCSVFGFLFGLWLFMKSSVISLWCWLNSRMQNKMSAVGTIKSHRCVWVKVIKQSTLYTQKENDKLRLWKPLCCHIHCYSYTVFYFQ